MCSEQISKIRRRDSQSTIRFLSSVELSALALPLFAILLLTTAQRVHAQTESILFNFTCRSGVCAPQSNLAIDGQGNLYGTTQGFYGAVYELSSSGEFSTLHSFSCCGSDGSEPEAGVILDSQGNLYGTTVEGGAYGEGTVFEVSPTGTETILYNFTCGSDGCFPEGQLVIDSDGNLYGTASAAGLGAGTVFKLVPSTGVLTTLYSFAGGADGGLPFSGLVFDVEGNLYGTTAYGGAYSRGVVYKLTPSGTETVLHSFDPNGKDGLSPQAGVVLDSKGDLYGTTLLGGKSGVGTVYKVTPSGKETILHSFKGGADGIFPESTLTFDKNGNLYGTTFYGGTFDSGTVFELSKTHETVLHSFAPNGIDGQFPEGGVLVDANGDIYGTTSAGGEGGVGCSLGCGTIFKIVPQSLGRTSDFKESD